MVRKRGDLEGLNPDCRGFDMVRSLFLTGIFGECGGLQLTWPSRDCSQWMGFGQLHLRTSNVLESL